MFGPSFPGRFFLSREGPRRVAEVSLQKRDDVELDKGVADEKDAGLS